MYKPFKPFDHLEGEQPHLGDLLTKVIIHYKSWDDPPSTGNNRISISSLTNINSDQLSLGLANIFVELSRDFNSSPLKENWVVVSNIFYFHPELWGRFPF